MSIWLIFFTVDTAAQSREEGVFNHILISINILLKLDLTLH